MHIYQPNYSWKLLLDYKKKIPARPERADFNSSFIRFVRCCKTSRRWKKKSLCCSFQASQQKKIFLAILNGWTLQRDQVCVKKCVTRNEKWNSQHSIYWPGNKWQKYNGLDPSHGKYRGWNGSTFEINCWADLAQPSARIRNSPKNLCSHFIFIIFFEFYIEIDFDM